MIITHSRKQHACCYFLDVKLKYFDLWGLPMKYFDRFDYFGRLVVELLMVEVFVICWHVGRVVVKQSIFLVC